MIITKSKSREEVLNLVRGYGRIFVLGCGTCATLCQTGGEEQVEDLAKMMGEKVKGKAVVEVPCDLRVLRRDLAQHMERIGEADAILTMCCGVGSQAVAEFTGKAVVPGLNALFVGETERIGKFYERCRACGDCVLYETGGICPVVRCAKGLMNGPCGGMAGGKCEVGGHVRDCAWVLIYKRLKEQGREEVFKKIRPVVDRSSRAQPQELVYIR